MEQEIKNINNFDLLKRKIEIMIAGRLRKKNKIMKAIEVQDNLSKKSGNWNSTAEIRKWREKR